jgi:hypothetical protein
MNLVAMKSGSGEIRMGWIKLTDPQGHPVYLSPEQIVRIRPCIAGAGDPASARSVVDLVNGTQATRETQDEIIGRIKNADKDEDKAAGA